MCKRACSMPLISLSAVPHIANLQTTRHQSFTISPPSRHCSYRTLRHSALHSPASMATAENFMATGHLRVLRDPVNTSQEGIE